MIKGIFKVVKRVVFAFFIVYSFNIIMSPLAMSIPLNLVTIAIISILGFPALLSLVVIFLIII